jgi:hypothetical protein
MFICSLSLINYCCKYDFEVLSFELYANVANDKLTVSWRVKKVYFYKKI